MDQDSIFMQMKTFFEDRVEPETLDRLADVKVVELLDESIDVVEFIVYLEDKLKARFSPNRIGPTMATLTFAEVASAIARELNEQPGRLEPAEDPLQA